MAKNNYLEPNKITLAGHVDKALDQTLARRNFIWGLRAIRIWPFNLKAMDVKT
jgi:hypothetical protein